MMACSMQQLILEAKREREGDDIGEHIHDGSRVGTPDAGANASLVHQAPSPLVSDYHFATYASGAGAEPLLPTGAGSTTTGGGVEPGPDNDAYHPP